MEKMENKIILTADTDLIDSESRKGITQLDTRISTINDRTKNHTFQIERLDKKIIVLDNDINKIKREIEELKKLK